MKPVLLLVAVAFVLIVALYGRNRRPFWIFQAVLFPVFLWFFGADVMLGKGETTSSLWFLPFVLVWIVGTAAFGILSLKHLFSRGEGMSEVRWHWPIWGRRAAVAFVLLQAVTGTVLSLEKFRAEARAEARRADAEGAGEQLGALAMEILDKSSSGVWILPYWAAISGALLVAMVFYCPRKVRP